MRDTSLGERLLLLRKRAGMTQGQVGELVDVQHSQVSRWERNEVMPSGDQLLTLRAHFGVSGHWLLTGEGPVYPEESDQKELAYDAIEALVGAMKPDAPLASIEERVAEIMRKMRARAPTPGEPDRG